MQITADISKIYIRSTFKISYQFCLNLVPQAVENVSFTENVFSRKRGVIMWKRAKAFVATIQCIIFFVYLLPLKSAVFVVYFSSAFQHGKEALPKHGSQTKIVPLLVIFDLTQLIQWFECFDFTKFEDQITRAESEKHTYIFSLSFKPVHLLQN